MDDYKMSPKELQVVWSLGAILSLRMLGVFMILPVLTTHGILLKGANESLIGMAIGIYGLMQALFQIPFGLLSDRIGYKQIIIYGLLIFIVGSIMAALSESIWGVIFGRALQGMGTIATAVMALLSDLILEQNLTKAMTFIGASFGINFTISLVIGPVITSYFGLQALFWIIAVLAIIGIIITLWIVPNNKYHSLNRDSDIVRNCFIKVLINPSLLKINFSIMCLHILLMFTFIAIPKQLIIVGLSSNNHWKVYLATMLISLITALPLIIYAELKHRIKLILLLCIIIMLNVEIIFWNIGIYFWSLILGIQFFFLAFNLIESILPSLVSKETPVGYKGTAMGIYSTSQFIGIFIGGSLGGLISNIFGSQAVFLAGALLAFAWLLIASTIKEPPYISSIRIKIPDDVKISEALRISIKEKKGVKETFFVPEENSIYLKIDSKLTNSSELEQIIKFHRIEIDNLIK